MVVECRHMQNFVYAGHPKFFIHRQSNKMKIKARLWKLRGATSGCIKDIKATVEAKKPFSLFFDKILERSSFVAYEYP